MENGTACDSLLQFLNEPSFARLADDAVRDYISWDELTERPTPAGCSAKQTWALLSAIRRLGAYVHPIPSLAGQHFWYNITSEGRACLDTIERHCGPDSVLHRTINEREGHRFLVNSRVKETIATCELDGIHVGQSNAQLFAEDRTPRTPVDRLLTNSYEMLKELDALASERFTPELVRHVYDRVSYGVDLAKLKRGRARTDLGDDRNPDDSELTPEIKAEMLLKICVMANGDLGDPFAPIPAQAYNILASMSYWQPMPDLNHTVSLYLQRLFVVKKDYPVLGCLPTSSLTNRWFNGSLHPGVVRFRQITRVSEQLDGTEDILTYLQLIVAAIDELNDVIAMAGKEDDALERALRTTNLNYRQRAILTKALANPSREFRIRQQQAVHSVVYATARADLLELVDLGYIRKLKRGQTFVFMSSEDLESRLGLRAGVSPGA